MSDKPRMHIPRLTDDLLREVVRDRLACKVMFSSEVRRDMVSMVFGCGMMGDVFMPPAEIMESVLGSATPPDSLPDEPDKPDHPGYPDPVGDPPEKPKRVKMPEQILSDISWGEIAEDDPVVHEARIEVKAENARRIREWEDASHAWHKALDEERRVQREIDAAYEAAVEAWQASLDQRAEKVAEREAAQQDWHDRYAEHFGEWFADVGVLSGDMSKTFPRSINGYPIFHGFQIIHKDDWKRIEAAIIREQERSENIEV